MNQWRTVGVASWAILALGLGLWLCGLYPSAVSVYPAFAGGIGVCVAAVAAKAAKQHTENAKAGVAP